MTRIEEQLRDEENKRICQRISKTDEKEKDIYLEAYKDALKYGDSIHGRISLFSIWCPLPWKDE